MHRLIFRTMTAMLIAGTTSAGLLHAQDSTATPRASRWTPFLGCWSSSSAGVIGPMVCVVPTDSTERVEFMTIVGDSVVARTVVDASGRYQPQRHGACQGLERARWSSDSLRVYIQADYRCARGESLRSDAILDFTHRDAFSYIEGSSGTADRVRIVNFIVQLDTLVYPDAVKRRLPAYRPLSMDVTELETPIGENSSIMKDFGAEVPFFVLDAWMHNRGESAVFALADHKEQRVVAKKRDAIARALRMQSAPLLAWEANGRVGDRWTVFGSDLWGAEMPAGYMLTPASVGFGQPFGPFASYVTPPANSVSFRWP